LYNYKSVFKIYFGVPEENANIILRRYDYGEMDLSRMRLCS